ncbi:ABC transporter ATP-binding protein [Hyperthermus butylicus]|uniref:ABC transporter ATP-binding protein n=1 Tax=Hyperthermus butylicus (strain DSM 5456 / JCM 9403 / PLM1-5) TaxID=415426 RepID=A2BL88_HYPBU|nr:ABC transporter ATP-binding protein [Hyperthermus butylicus]ABM80749.1 ABC transporter ATP-binding protein [Hyperthermus butylicus DSM 5456]
MPCNELVKLVNVVKVYGSGETRTYGLRGVSLTVCSGEFIAIMGPSGSGKSTLLNIIGLLDKPTSGKVYIDGVDVEELSSRELAMLRNRKIGFVFQHFNLISRLTVLENIELPLIARGVPRRARRELAVKALLRVGGDTSWLAKKPTQLSGGQQQRVAIARAIVGNPDLILADEPTGNLDRVSARTVVKTFIELNQAGQTIILVTHDPEVANCARKIYVIRDGRIVGKLEPDPSKCILNTVQ